MCVCVCIKSLLLWRKSMTDQDSILKSMCELDHKEGWVLKNWCFWTVEMEKTLESPLDCKENKLVNPKGNQFWIFIGKTDAATEASILWPPDAKSWLIGKDPNAGKDWRQEEKGMTEDEMGWMASLTQWTWVWTSSGRWWRTGKSGVLQFIGSQRVRYDSNWTTYVYIHTYILGSFSL